MSKSRSKSRGMQRSAEEILGITPAVFRQRLRTEVVPAIKDEWIKIINQYVDVRRRQRLIEGIRVSPNYMLSLSLKGWDAVRTERGWAPVRGNDILTDGLGHYTGTVHDMKPIILRGEKSRTIKFEYTKTIQETAQYYREVLEKAIHPALIRSVNIQAMVETFWKRLRKLPYSPPGEGGHTISNSGLIFPKLREGHATSIFSRIHKHHHKSKRGYVLTIYREMDIKQKGLWLTTGTPPANTIPRLVEKLPEVLYNIFFKK